MLNCYKLTTKLDNIKFDLKKLKSKLMDKYNLSFLIKNKESEKKYLNWLDLSKNLFIGLNDLYKDKIKINELNYKIFKEEKLYNFINNKNKLLINELLNKFNFKVDKWLINYKKILNNCNEKNKNFRVNKSYNIKLKNKNKLYIYSKNKSNIGIHNGFINNKIKYRNNVNSKNKSLFLLQCILKKR